MSSEAHICPHSILLRGTLWPDQGSHYWLECPFTCDTVFYILPNHDKPSSVVIILGINDEEVTFFLRLKGLHNID